LIFAIFSFAESHVRRAEVAGVEFAVGRDLARQEAVGQWRVGQNGNVVLPADIQLAAGSEILVDHAEFFPVGIDRAVLLDVIDRGIRHADGANFSLGLGV